MQLQPNGPLSVPDAELAPVDGLVRTHWTLAAWGFSSNRGDSGDSERRAIASAACLEPAPLVTRARSRTVAKLLSTGLVVRRSGDDRSRRDGDRADRGSRWCRGTG